MSDRKVSLSIIGSAGCGKTSLFHRFTTGKYSATPTITVGMDYSTKTMVVRDPHTGEDDDVRVDVWDTAGMERFRSSVKSLYRSKDAILVAYDISSSATFEEAQVMTQFLRDTCGDASILAAVGCKADLDAEREVDRDAAERWAEDRGMRLHEISAKTGEGVDELFAELVTSALHRQEPGSPSRSPNKVYARSPFDEYGDYVAGEVSSPDSPSDDPWQQKRRRPRGKKKCC